MSFWKLVAAIIVGNLLTGVVVAGLWLLFLASLLSGIRDGGAGTQAEAPISTPASQATEAPTGKYELTKSPSAKGRKLSPPDANGCVKELAEEVGGHC